MVCPASYEPILWVPTSKAALRSHKAPSLFCGEREMVKELHNCCWQTSVATFSHCSRVFLSSIGTMETSSLAMISKSGLACALKLPCAIQVLSLCIVSAVSLAQQLLVNVFWSSPFHYHVALTRYKSWSGQADQTCFDYISCSMGPIPVVKLVF